MADSVVVASVLAWADAVLRLKTLGEVRRSLEPDHIADLRHGEPLLAEQHGGLLQPHTPDVVERGDAEIFFYKAVELLVGNAAALAQQVDVKVGV